MSRKRTHGSGREKIRKLTRTSKYSYYITIPKAYIDKLGWRERQKVVVELEGETLVVRDWEENGE
ncbi:MAG: AbrB/MazE/SpoVT family DNA-binding domain-containing protein [candidate division KSB1 bacterium]|nr:AbrB/MazE/SpoVT family DNA-binding domain-containing protein [candidate division KSB1 bacterium]